MKNLQVNFKDEVYREIEEFAKKENITVADVVRIGVQLYMIAAIYRDQGKILQWEDKKNEEKTILLIPKATVDSGISFHSAP